MRDSLGLLRRIRAASRNGRSAFAAEDVAVVMHAVAAMVDGRDFEAQLGLAPGWRAPLAAQES